jgi:hypothetical protein
MAKPTDPQVHINWSEILRNNQSTASEVYEASTEACPDPGEVKGMTTDQYALQAAKAQGWRDAVNYIFKEFPNQRFVPNESPFMDTAMESEKE